MRVGNGKHSKDVNADHISQRLGRHSEIHFTPAGSGAISRGGKKIIAGVAILGIAITGGALAAPVAGAAGFAAGMSAPIAFGITWTNLALFGAATILTGAAAMLAGDANIARYEQREAPEDRPNFVLSGAVNTLNEGGAVQWIYGKRVRVGSTVLSAGIFDEQIGPGLPQPEADGLIGRFTGAAAGIVGN